MNMPVVAGNFRAKALPASGLLALLRKSLSAHSIFIAIVAVYAACFATLLHLRPDITAVSFLAAAIGFLGLSVPFILLSIFNLNNVANKY